MTGTVLDRQGAVPDNTYNIAPGEDRDEACEKTNNGLINAQPLTEFKHIVSDSLADFATHYNQLSSRRAALYPQSEADESYSPYPLAVPPARVAEAFGLFAALHPALVAVVRAWWSRPDWKEAIAVPEKIERALRALDSVREYNDIGSIRPDYIIPPTPEQSLRICEINARFIFNGFWSTVVQDHPLHDCGFPHMGSWQPSTLTGQDMIDEFDALADPSRPIYVVTASELSDPKASKFGLRPYLWTHASIRVVHPSALQVDSDGTLTDGAVQLDQVILQLKQVEIEALEDDVLLALGKVCHNDLRTIYFVHDKRLLGLIRQELPWLVEQGALHPDQAAALHRGLAETCIPGTVAYDHIGATASREEWTLKKYSSGKGDGMIFGKNVSADEWAVLVGAKTHLLQRYYKSLRIPMVALNRTQRSPRPERVNWPVVGTIMAVNRRLVGMSVFRANDSDAIAIATKGSSLCGVTEPGIPRTLTLPSKPCRYLELPPSTSINVPINLFPTPEYLEAVRGALVTEGVAILRLPAENPDPSSSHLAALSQMIGTPISHSASHGILWEVTPSPKGKGSGARSHGPAVFPWHTDCSYEPMPPRYFGLHIVRPDRFQGGRLQLLPVADLESLLSPGAVTALQSPDFRFDVPAEFDKGSPSTTGRVLTPEGKMRWRRDIITGLTPAAADALAEVDAVLARNDGVVLGPNEMKAGVIVCIDNAKWLHARSTVNDMTRLLRRVRWGSEDF